MLENPSTGANAVVEPLAYSTADAARAIGISPRTLKNWRYEGRGPTPTRLSPVLVVYRREDLDRWLREQQRAGGASA